MKLSTRLGVVVGVAAFGRVVLAGVALLVLRGTMLADRHAQISQTLKLAVVAAAQSEAGSAVADYQHDSGLGCLDSGR